MPNVSQTYGDLHRQVVDTAHRLSPFCVAEAFVADAIEMVASLSANNPPVDEPSSWTTEVDDQIAAASSALTAELAHHSYVLALARVCVLLGEAWDHAGDAEEALDRLVELHTEAGS